MAGKAATDMKLYDFVAADKQWTNSIRLETEAAKKWVNKWGFLVTQRDEIKAEQEKLRNKCRLVTPEHLKVRPASPISKYIKVGPSPAVPQTTQGFIGWRSAVPGLELERYGGPQARKMELPPSDEVARRQHRMTDHLATSPPSFTTMLKTAAFDLSVVTTPGCPSGF